MAVHQPVFALIKSLSRSEKRYFKLFAARSGNDSNYLKLFEAIDRQAEYDEAAIKACFPKEKFVRQLHVTKHHLCALILKSLRNYHQEHSVHSRLLHLLHNIEILYEKELYPECHQQIDLAIQLAELHEKNTLLAELLAWKRKVLLASSPLPSAETDAVTAREKQALEQARKLNDYWQRVMHIQDAPAPDLTPAPPAHLPLQAKVMHYHMQHIHYFLQGKQAASEQAANRLIKLLEQHPERIRDDPRSYVAALGNKTAILLGTGKWDRIQAVIEQIKSVPARYGLREDSKFTFRLRLRTYNLELELYRDSHQWDKALALIKEVTAFIDKRKSAVPEDYQLLFYYQFAYIYFKRKELPAALPWLNRILNGRYGDMLQDILVYAWFLNIIVHFELGNHTVVKYAIDSCSRYLKQQKMMRAFEAGFLQLFAKLISAHKRTYGAIYRQSFATLFWEQDPHRNVLDYLDIRAWLEEKTANQRS